MDILHKKSAIADKIPQVTDLLYGELAINFKDKRLYFRSSDDTIEAISNSEIASESSKAEHQNSTIIASKNTKSGGTNKLAGGYAASGPASSANRKWELDSAAGTLSLAGSVSTSSGFADFAEYFENLDLGIIELGTLVTLEADKIRPAKANESILGVVSATAGITLNDSEFAWSQRYLRGDFGELLRDENGELIENPDYDASKPHVKRSERPHEWSCVGLIGQVYVRVTESVKSGDYIKAASKGRGGKASQKTNLRCMKITKSFDKNNGFAIALCVLK